jgi:hypothetical protein
LEGSSATAVVDLADPPPANLAGLAVVPIPEPAVAALLGSAIAVAVRRRA